MDNVWRPDYDVDRRETDLAQRPDVVYVMTIHTPKVLNFQL